VPKAGYLNFPKDNGAGLDYVLLPSMNFGYLHKLRSTTLNTACYSSAPQNLGSTLSQSIEEEFIKQISILGTHVDSSFSSMYNKNGG
jgi:hypothetical protein